MIKGNLASFSLGEIFQSLAVNSHTGTMKILEKSGEEKYLYFSKGEICLFSSSSHPSLRIGEILIRRGVISRDELESALEMQKDSTERLGSILRGNFGVSEADLQLALEVKICEEIYDLFLLNEAEFEFFVDHFPEEIFESFEKNVHISINTTSVLMEGLRLADEWKVIQKKVGSFNEIFTPVQDAPQIQPDSDQEAAILEQVDGKTPVHRIFDHFPGSRFDCCKAIFEFLGAGRIRALTLDECRKKGELAARRGEVEVAIDYLNYATQLGPDRPEPFVLVGNLLEKLDREKEAQAAHMKATQLFFQAGDYKHVVEVGEGLLRSHPRDEELLTAVFQAAMDLKKKHLASSSGESLARLLIDRGSRIHAAEVLLRLLQLSPRDLDRRLRVASILREGTSQDVGRAAAILEEGLEILGSRGDLSDRIKLQRQLFELCPDRQDIKQEISNLLALQEQATRRKKAKVTLFGVTIIAVLLLTLVPILYEIKARELYSHAQRLERISEETGNFSVAVEAYDRLVDEYSLSTRAGMAESARESLLQRERARAEVIQKVEEDEKNRHAEQLGRARKEVRERFELASSLEARGDFVEAHRLYFELLQVDENLYPPGVGEILLPVTVTSEPPGCTVTIDRKVVGKTPLVLRERQGEPLNLHLERAGCEPANLASTFGSQPAYHFEMKLRPLTDFQISGPIHHEISSDGDDIVFPSRDGFFYSFSPRNQKLNWRRVIGHYGDRISHPHYSPIEIVFGNVNGEVTAIARATGKSRWRLFLEAPVLARPTLSASALHVAVGDTAGRLSIIDHRQGKLLGQFQTENEILRAPAFWKYMAIVASQDNNLYFVASPRANKVLHQESFRGEVSSDLQVHEDTLLFTTSDGQLHSFDLPTLRFRWSRGLEGEPVTEPITHGEHHIVGLENGEIVAIHAESGATAWRESICEGSPGEMAREGSRIYLGTAGGEVLSFDLETRQKQWTYHSDVEIDRAPLIFGHHLFVVATSGKFIIMELFR